MEQISKRLMNWASILEPNTRRLAARLIPRRLHCRAPLMTPGPRRIGTGLNVKAILPARR